MGFMTDTHYYEGTKTTFLKTGLRVAALVFPRGGKPSLTQSPASIFFPDATS